MIDQKSAVEAEQTLIATCFRSELLHDKVAEILSADDFTDPTCQIIYKLITGMRDIGNPVNIVTAGDVLKRSELYREISQGTDPTAYIAELLDAAPLTGSAMGYAQMIKSATLTRKMQSASAEMYELSLQDYSTGEKIQQASDLVAAFSTADMQESTDLIGVPAKSVADRIIHNSKNGVGVTGISTGLYEVDQMTTGLHPGDLMILAGRPSMGKTLAAVNIAMAAATKHPVLFFSLEMEAEQLALRELANAAQIPLSRLRRNNIMPGEYVVLERAQDSIDQSKLRIDDRGGLHVDELRTRARMEQRKNGLSMVVIDYLQLLRGEGNNKTHEMGYVSRSCKEMAKELKVPVILLSQLNRAVDARPDKRPLLSDLRDSGEIEQDADIVCYCYRDEVYNEHTHLQGVMELIFRKQRNGVIGTCNVEYEGAYQQIRDMKRPVPSAPAKKSKSDYSYGKKAANNGA